MYSLENEINFASTFAAIARAMFAVQAYEDGERALEKAERAHVQIRHLLRQLCELEEDASVCPPYNPEASGWAFDQRQLTLFA